MQDGSEIEIKLKQKNKRTGSNIWPATVLSVGHKSFVERWAYESCLQIEGANGQVDFVPLVPLADPDLTLYEDVNDYLLRTTQNGQGAVKKLNTTIPLTGSNTDEPAEPVENGAHADNVNEQRSLNQIDLSRIVDDEEDNDNKQQLNISEGALSQVNNIFC